MSCIGTMTYYGDACKMAGCVFCGGVVADGANHQACETEHANRLDAGKCVACGRVYVPVYRCSRCSENNLPYSGYPGGN